MALLGCDLTNLHAAPFDAPLRPPPPPPPPRLLDSTKSVRALALALASAVLDDSPPLLHQAVRAKAVQSWFPELCSAVDLGSGAYEEGGADSAPKVSAGQ